MKKMATPDELLAFVRIAENGGFAAAARELGVTPSAASKLLTRLEQRLETQLLTRTTRRVSLTAEGNVYLDYAREILASISEAAAAVASNSERPSGLLRLNAGIAFGRHQLIPALPLFMERYPDIEIRIEITDKRIEVRAEDIDVVFRSGTLTDSPVVAKKIAEARRIICASPDYLNRCGIPETPEHLLNHNCLLITQYIELTRWHFRTANENIELAVKGNVSAGSADALCDLALAGHGVVCLLETMVADPLQRGALVPLLTNSYVADPVPIWALTPPIRNRIPRVKVLLDFLAEYFRTAPWNKMPFSHK